MGSYQLGMYATGRSNPSMVQQSTSKGTRTKSAARSGIVNTSRSRTKIGAEFDPVRSLQGKAGLLEGISSLQDPTGTYDPTQGAYLGQAAHQRQNRNVAAHRANRAPLPVNRARRLDSISSSRHFLSRVTGPTKGRSSRDSTKETYSTMETRSKLLGPEILRQNVSQMFRANTSNKGAIRRSQRKFL